MRHEDNRAGRGHAGAIGDFTATRRMVPIALLATVLGGFAAFVAVALLRLIALFTNLFYFQRFSLAAASPAAHSLGVLAALAPVAGGLIVGLMARFGSDRIRGHGIPEALEAILIRGSRIEPRVAVLKPISAAISIGSGGPFGSEGPIIMTGGAVGSILAQLLRLTGAERKTLLVAGAAAGMSATFASPIAAVILAVELLLFELKPRSFVPVAFASASAMLVRTFLLGPGPLFTLSVHGPAVTPPLLGGAVVAGLVAGLLAAAMTASVYAAEDAFAHLPLHWMWWPAFGGVAIGLGGLLCPSALGVGYDRIQALLSGDLALRAVLLLVAVKWAIWAVSLGSGTSGGVLAPLLMMGSAFGALLTPVLPPGGTGFWPLVTMAATLAGTMRAPLTAVAFATELTGDFGMTLPLLVGAATAHGLTVLILRRSILTEKVARRGFHITREYATDPLEHLFIREIMRTELVTLTPTATVRAAAALAGASAVTRRQRLYPVIDAAGDLAGVITREDLEGLAAEAAGDDAPADRTVASIIRREPLVAYTDEPLSDVIHRIAPTRITRLPVVAREAPRRLLGLVALSDVLKARARYVEGEVKRERVLAPRLLGLAHRLAARFAGRPSA